MKKAKSAFLFPLKVPCSLELVIQKLSLFLTITIDIFRASSSLHKWFHVLKTQLALIYSHIPNSWNTQPNAVLWCKTSILYMHCQWDCPNYFNGYIKRLYILQLFLEECRIKSGQFIKELPRLTILLPGVCLSVRQQYSCKHTKQSASPLLK